MFLVCSDRSRVRLKLSGQVALEGAVVEEDMVGIVVGGVD